ncbi:MAG: hypothetical protein AAGA03_12845 [Planctomycetota bacterium]
MTAQPVAQAQLPVEGKWIRLQHQSLTDDEAKTLVASFDAAVPQWLEYWDIDQQSIQDWKIQAWVIDDVATARRRGIVPVDLPEFRYGYASGKRIWVVRQPSEYYTRHLLLHEGVHALMFRSFGGAGPSWFMEGTAELLSLHQGQEESTRVNRLPRDADDTPYWGRLTMLSDRRQTDQSPSLAGVMRLPQVLRGDVESFGWSWAAVLLLDTYPAYHLALDNAAKRGREAASVFNRRLYEDLRQEWPIVQARWALLCDRLDYGFDPGREQVQLSTQDPRWNGQQISAEVVADRGWQSCGVWFPAGATLRLQASGDCVLADTTRPWRSEPQGITIHYHKGRPLGELLACVLPLRSDKSAAMRQPIRAIPVGRKANVSVPENSWLLMCINDPVGQLDDNSGSYQVKMSRFEPRHTGPKD